MYTTSLFTGLDYPVLARMTNHKLHLALRKYNCKQHWYSPNKRHTPPKNYQTKLWPTHTRKTNPAHNQCSKINRTTQSKKKNCIQNITMTETKNVVYDRTPKPSNSINLKLLAKRIIAYHCQINIYNQQTCITTNIIQ